MVGVGYIDLQQGRMSPEREVNPINGQHRQWVHWQADMGLTNGKYRGAVSRMQQASNHGDLYLAESLFFPLARLPLKLSHRGFGSPEMRKRFIFDFLFVWGMWIRELGWSRRITICQEPTRMVRPMRFRNFMRSRTAKINWKLIQPCIFQAW